MKKILIVLMVCVIVSIAMPVLAKVEFGNWDKWDEMLPPAENESWYWTIGDWVTKPSPSEFRKESWYWIISGNKPRILGLKGFGGKGKDVELLFSDMYFFADKKGKKRASVIFYSSYMDVKKWDIPNADFALAAFPPKNGKTMIMAYKMEENQVFRFFDQWEIKFKDHEVVVSQDAKFREEFKTWIKAKAQISSESFLSEDMTDILLPELRIWEQGGTKMFFITDWDYIGRQK